MLLSKKTFGFAWWNTKQHFPFLVITHRKFCSKCKITHVQDNGAVVLKTDEILKDMLFKFSHSLAIAPTKRCESHKLVLATVDFESAIISKSRIQKTERMRKPHFLEDSDLIPFTETDCSVRPFSTSIYG